MLNVLDTPRNYVRIFYLKVVNLSCNQVNLGSNEVRYWFALFFEMLIQFFALPIEDHLKILNDSFYEEANEL